MEMWCIPSWKMGLFGAVYMLGLAISSLFMRIGDYIGRIRFLTIMGFINIGVVCYLFWVPVSVTILELLLRSLRYK